MDQVKKQLAIVMQYGFWIGSGIILLGSLGVWWTTTSTLQSENTTRTSKLDQNHTTVNNVRSELDTQPNDHSHEKMEELIEGRKTEVLDSWELLYQKQEGLLVWPGEDKLSKDLVSEYVGKVPIEVHVEFSSTGENEIDEYLRDEYRTYIGDVLPDIAEIAKTKWTATFNKTAGALGGMGQFNPYNREDATDITGNDSGPLVKWSEQSQDDVMDDLFPWRGGIKPPTTLEIYYSQENLWILKQMLEIIAKVNGDAQQPYQAKIHEIARISIGDSVDFSAGEIAKPGEGVGGIAGMEGYEMDMEGGEMDMEMSLAGDGVSIELTDPADNRYVNTKNEPISGSALRGALTSNSAADAELAVAKRVPVMMSLQIDQRAIQQLLAECGSAPLMVDVGQVRILPKSGLKTLGGGAGGMMGEMEEEMEDMGNDMAGMTGMSGMTAPAAKKPVEDFPLDMAVEIYGLIYIYNKPDPVKLGVEEVDKNTVIEGVTDTDVETATPPVTVATPDTNDVLPTPSADPPAADAPVADPAATEPPAAAPAAEETPATPATPAVPPATTEPPVAGSGPGTPPPAIVLPQ